MKLSDLLNKQVYAGTKRRGTVKGLGLAYKNGAVKYLLCASPSERADFCVSVNAIEEIDEEELYLSRLRPVFPKSCISITQGLPTYTDGGEFLGNVSDMELRDFFAVHIQTDKDERFSPTLISACNDAIILRKKQPFPLGQRIPATVVSDIFDKNETLVTRSNLKEAAKKGALIKLTLSLAPFAFV